MKATIPEIAQPGHPAPVSGYRMGLISLLAAAVGIIAGLIAYALYDLIGLFTNLAYYHIWSFHFRSPENTTLGPWIILIPVIGGLIIGVMAKYGSDKIKGHGIPEAMEAVLLSRSRIESKVAILKPLSAAIAIGTGGPFGAEGPIIQTGGAFGSIIGQIISTTASERKVLLAAGAGAGMAATFNTPIAGVILAIELLLFEFRARSFIPLVVASTLATSTRYLLLGQHSMFQMGQVDYGLPVGLPFYLLLGGLCGIAAIGFTKLLYFVEDQFERLPISDFWHPAIGALGLGIIGFFVPRVLGVGYDTISDILNNHLALKLLILIAICKALALVISLGSGTSGGLLAPMFMSSAAMGGVFAVVVNLIFSNAHLSPGAYALVAMGAVFGAASRATFTFIVFAFEITHDFNAILPLMLVSVIADAIALKYLPSSIMTEKLSRRGLDVHQEFEVDVLKQVRVRDIMQQNAGAGGQTEAAELGDVAAKTELEVENAMAIGANKELPLEMHHEKQFLQTLEDKVDESSAAKDGTQRSPIVAYPDERAFDALYRMLKNDIGNLPVVSRSHPPKVLGFVNRSHVLKTWTRQMEDENLREKGWIGGMMTRRTKKNGAS
jgi:CIC family chloride channel protein